MTRTWLLGLAASCIVGCGSSSDAAPAAGSGEQDTGADASPADALVDTGAEATTTDAPRDALANDADTRPAVDTGAGPDAATDAASDAGDAGDPLAPLLGCLGTEQTLTVSSQMPYANVPVGAGSGEFLVDFATTFSSIDLAAFPAPGPTTHGCDPTKLYQTCTVDGFAFFSPPGPVQLVTESFAGFGGSVRQAGIVGTDFTSLKIMTVAYASHRLFGSDKTGFCADTALVAAGFAALPTDGYFSDRYSALLPMTAVDSSAGSGHVPDVPTVPVRIGGASAIAQLDTGFDDALVHFSINVNGAFYSAIVAADPGALVRDSAHDLTLSTCTGASESVQAYKLASGRAFELVDGAGAAVRKTPDATVFVKTSSPKACGGIGTWTVPAAQVAASFFVDLGTMVFDPYSSRVWVPR